MSSPVRILLAEDDPGMQIALGALLEAHGEFELVAVASDAGEAIALAERTCPDVCLVDVAMPGGGGPHAARTIRERVPAAQVLALSGRQDRESVVEMLRAGACGYLVKGNDVDELIEAVHAAASGRSTVSKQVAGDLVGELATKLAREDVAAERERAARARIAHVLSGGLLSMVFQPVVALGGPRAGEVLFFEALARFATEPVRAPNLWFDEAARVGMLLELELAAAGHALAALPRLPAGAAVSINVSPSTAVSNELLAMLPPSLGERMIVELTEHAPIEDYDEFCPRLERLRRRGVRVAIDDAGAGFASLRHILRVQPEVIKADMSLTRRVAEHRGERAMLRAFGSFAAETGAVFVAEGIETDAEIAALRELGVEFGQGFRLGRPERAPAAMAHTRAGAGAWAPSSRAARG